MKLTVELSGRLICEMPYGDVCASSDSISAGGHNELLLLCAVYFSAAMACSKLRRSFSPSKVFIWSSVLQTNSNNHNNICRTL